MHIQTLHQGIQGLEGGGEEVCDGLLECATGFVQARTAVWGVQAGNSRECDDHDVGEAEKKMVHTNEDVHKLIQRVSCTAADRAVT